MGNDFNTTSSFYFVPTGMSRRLPRRGRSLQMRTAYFIHWENAALSPSLTTSSSPLCCPVSTALKCTDILFQSLILDVLDNVHKSNPRASLCPLCSLLRAASVKKERGKQRNLPIWYPGHKDDCLFTMMCGTVKSNNQACCLGYSFLVLAENTIGLDTQSQFHIHFLNV